MQDLFEVQTQDYQVVQGDTLNLAWPFNDKKGNPINDIYNQQWGSIFSLEDPITHDLITALQKTHNDITPEGNGVYYFGDIYTIPGLNIVNRNQVVVLLKSIETETLVPAIYPYYFKFFINQAYTADFTPVRGNLKVLKRNT